MPFYSISSARSFLLDVACTNTNNLWKYRIAWYLNTILNFLNLFNLFFFLFFIIIFYCSGFCHTLKWISHGFTCVPHPDPPSHLPLHPIPLGLPSATGPSACLMHPNWAGDLFHPRYIHVSMLFSWNIPPSPSPTESVLYICVSFSVVHIGLSLTSF